MISEDIFMIIGFSVLFLISIGAIFWYKHDDYMKYKRLYTFNKPNGLYITLGDIILAVIFTVTVIVPMLIILALIIGAIAGVILFIGSCLCNVRLFRIKK